MSDFEPITQEQVDLVIPSKVVITNQKLAESLKDNWDETMSALCKKNPLVSGCSKVELDNYGHVIMQSKALNQAIRENIKSLTQDKDIAEHDVLDSP